VASANQQLADDAVAHRLFLLRFEAGTVRAMLDAYHVALGTTERRLKVLHAQAAAGKTVSPAAIARLVETRAALTAEVRALDPILNAILHGRLVEAAEVEARVSQAKLLSAVAPEVRALLAGVPTAQVAAAVMQPIGGTLWSDRISRDLFELQDALKRQIGASLAAGSSIPRAAKALKDAVGVVETYRNRLVSIARTEIQRVANTVALANYQHNSDVVGGVVYLATLDSRTCLVCAPFHNKVFRYNGAGLLPPDAPAVPQHPRCRCFYAPVTRSWREMGLDIDDPGHRRRMDGKRPENMDFESWLKRQPVERQVEVFGPARHDLWSNGRLRMDRFSDQGRVLNLGELAARYPSA
jgi:SPP1 gp7 family putative phage head morphogenesis protein